MKIAILVVGGHYSGKTKTINKYLKKLLKMPSIRTRRFVLNAKDGITWAQSLEEANRTIDSFISVCIRFELIVVPCRPLNEKPSYLAEVRKRLAQEGFKVFEVTIERTSNESYYKEKANEIFGLLNR